MSTKSTFRKNGGYFVDGVAYMDCKITGESVANVSLEAVSVIGSKALHSRMSKMFPESEPKSKPRTGRPSGWHFMKEFVDKDGNVFHKGVEQPKLKGTLPPTKVKPKKKPTKRRSQVPSIDQWCIRRFVVTARNRRNDTIRDKKVLIYSYNCNTHL